MPQGFGLQVPAVVLQAELLQAQGLRGVCDQGQGPLMQQGPSLELHTGDYFEGGLGGLEQALLVHLGVQPLQKAGLALLGIERETRPT